MTLETLEQRSNKPWLIIAAPPIQRALMQRTTLTQKPRTYLTIQDLFKKVFFAYHPGALKATSHYLGVSLAIASSYLRWLPWLKDTVQDPLVTRLLDLKAHLTQLNLLKTTPHLDAYLARYDVVFYGDLHHPLIARLTPHLEAHTNVFTVQEEPAMASLTLTTFKTLDEEIYATLTALRQRHDAGIPLEEMIIYAPSIPHRTRLLLEAPYFGLPLCFPKQAALISFPHVQQFYHAFLAHEGASLYPRLEHALKTVFEPLKPQHGPLYKRLLNVLHTYILESNDTVDAVLLKYYLGQETFASPSENGVRVLDTRAHVAGENTHLFVIGAHDQALVPMVSDRDLLPERIKVACGYPSAWEENLASVETVKQWLLSYPHLSLSWSRKSDLERVEQSPLFEQFAKDYPHHHTLPQRPLEQPYSEVLDQLESKIAYEAYQAYGAHDEALRLVAQHSEHLAVYDSQFKGLKEDTLEKLLPKPLTLSYTALNRFFYCHFAYFCERILKLTAYERTFAMSMGTVIHYLLEHHIHEPALTKAHFEEALATLAMTDEWQPSDHHSAWRQFAWLQDVFQSIKTQHAQTLMALSETEKQLTFPLPNHPGVIFKGVVDKLMRQTLNQQDLAIIVDYKTGKPQLDPVRAMLGLNAQLIYYAYVLANIDSTIQTVGFYEQPLVPSQKFKYEKKTFEQQFDEYIRWQGYSLEDESVLSIIDPNYASSTLIKNLSLTREGNFNAYFKRFDEAMLSRAFTRVSNQLSYAVETIQAGRFDINPYVEANGTLLACDYCTVKDLCYKKPHHYRTIPQTGSIFDEEDTV